MGVNVCRKKSIRFSLYIDGNVRGFMRLNIVRGYLNLQDMDAVLSVERVESKIEGLLDDEESTAFINEMIEQLASWILEENQTAISTAIREVAMPLINSVLNQLTLNDIIGRRQARFDARHASAMQRDYARV